MENGIHSLLFNVIPIFNTLGGLMSYLRL